MNYKNNGYIPTFEDSQIETVTKKFNPQSNRACNNNILFSSGQDSYSGDYYGYSLKRSNLINCNFDNAKFDHTSFCGSILEKIKFKSNCTFNSVYLEQCVMSDIIFGDGIKIENSNFSDSQLKKIKFNSSELRGVYFDNSILSDCSFNNCIIRASMFENAFLTNCSLINCNMRNLNIEFAIMENCDLSGTVISFFQFPYIIGIFGSHNNINNSFVGINKTQTIPIKEYIKNIEDVIIYFSGLKEYFPLANLYYAIEKPDIAYNCIYNGIDSALSKNDIRMVENYCKLGQVYDLLSIGDIKDILKRVDKAIESQRKSQMYGILLSKSYHLKAAISQNTSKAKFEITIETNVESHNFDIISSFCQDIDNIISSLYPKKITTTYQLSHNSPFEICLTCIGATADLVAIAGPLYQFILQKMKKSTKITPEIKEYIQNNNNMYLTSLNNEFDLFEQVLKTTKKSEHSEIIRDFRGKIITTATEQINKNFALLVSL